jgi:hypothetical protein
LDEESAADEKLTRIAEKDLYPKANRPQMEEGEEVEETDVGRDITPTDETDEEDMDTPRMKPSRASSDLE